jgi:hypothetical protein
MQRCARVALAGVALALALPALAQMQRRFPPTALRGEAEFAPAPAITLDGHAARMAPGARIRGTNNLIVMPSSLVGSKAVVHYTVDPLGLVQDVWILTDEERARKPWPTTPQQAASWHFDVDAQTWSKP